MRVKCLGTDFSESLLLQIKIPKEPLKKKISSLFPSPSLTPNKTSPRDSNPRDFQARRAHTPCSVHPFQGCLLKAHRGTREVRLQSLFIYAGLQPPGFSRPKPRGCLPALGCLLSVDSQVFQVEIFPSSKHQVWPSQKNHHAYHQQKHVLGDEPTDLRAQARLRGSLQPTPHSEEYFYHCWES